MRREQHVVEVEQRRSLRRLGLEHVEAGAGEASGGQRLVQRRLVDQPAARGVDQEGATASSARARADRSDGASPARAACAARRSRPRAAARRARPARCRMRRREGLVGQRIGGQHPHVEGAAAARHRLADPAEADDAHAAAPEPGMKAAAPAPAGDPRRDAAAARARGRWPARRRSRRRSRDWCRTPSPRRRRGASRRRRRPGRSRRRSGRRPAAQAPRRTPARCRARRPRWSRSRPAGARSARPRSAAGPCRSSRCRSRPRATARETLPVGRGAVGCCRGPCARPSAPPDHVSPYDTRARPIHYCRHRGIAK